jgi:hypothetical protein
MKINENKFYVYIHKRLDDGIVFYVGKGYGRRAYLKSKSKRSSYWLNIVNCYGYSIEIIENNLTEDEAYEKEMFYINYYNTYNKHNENGANFTIGGRTCTGYQWSGNQRANHPFNGNTNNRVPIIQFNPNGEFIKEWDFIQQAAKELGLTRTTIGSCCRGKVKIIAKQYVFRFKGDAFNKFSIEYKDNPTEFKKGCVSTKKKPLICYTVAGEFVKRYDSVAEACLDIKAHGSNIRKVIDGTRTHTKGYIFKYEVL